MSLITYICLLFLGQRIFQLPQVDFGKRPDRFGLEVHHWWRSLWTSQFGGLFPAQSKCHLMWLLGFIWNVTCPFRLISMNWSRAAQRSLSPMTTRRNTSSKHSSLSGIKDIQNDSLLTDLLFASLVMQWRFVNRVLKQMTAFKEVRTSRRGSFPCLM